MVSNDVIIIFWKQYFAKLKLKLKNKKKNKKKYLIKFNIYYLII